MTHMKIQSDTTKKSDRVQEEHDNPDKVLKDKYTRTEIGGPGGLEPTRYGDWEKNGRCIDF
jgi:hypothetical protein